MRRRFFVERFEGDRAVLAGDSARHLARVLRAKAGQVFELSDGETVRLAEVRHVEPGRVEFGLGEPAAAEEPALAVELLLSVVKFDRFEWSLEKASELGVTEIVPLGAARSDAGLLRAVPKRAARWEKILYEAAQQSRRMRPAVLRGLARPAAAFSAASGVRKILLSERPMALRLKEVLEGGKRETQDGAQQSVSLALGPEGGWTEAEFQQAADNGFEEASLGRGILRTETAVIAALASVKYALEDGG